MSVGGGFKKGKAEFAMKDIDGNDIKTATESFSIGSESEKLLTVNGINLDNLGNSKYGIYFTDGENESNIYQEGSVLHFSGNSLFETDVQIGSHLVDVDGVFKSAGENPAYLSVNRLGGVRWKETTDVHCWTLMGSNYTFKLYIADYTGNTASENLYTYFANETSIEALNKKYDKVFNIRGFVSIDANEYRPQSYTIERSGTEGNYVITIKFRIIGEDANNALALKRFNVKINSNSYQNGNIKCEF